MGGHQQMSTTYPNMSRCASQALNDWLCARVSSVNSFEALENIAKDHSAFKDDAATMRVVAKVWCDHLAGKVSPRGQVTEFERRLLLTSDSRRGAAAIVLLLELRCRWRLTDKFPLSSRAPKRSIVPELRRDAFEGAVEVLQKAGCIQLVRESRYAGDFKFDAALYGLHPVRQDGELPEVKEEIAQVSPKKPQATTKKKSVSDAHQSETPPMALPEASDAIPTTEEVAATMSEEQPTTSTTPEPAMVSEPPVEEAPRVDIPAEVAARIKKLVLAVQLDKEQQRVHAKLIWRHYDAEHAGKKFLLPEEVWEVWKQAGFDFPVPMTRTEHTKLHNHTEWMGGLSAAEVLDFLKIIREPESTDEEPDWEALREFQRKVAATMVVNSLVVTPTPKEKFERAPLPEDQWPTMSSADRRRIHEWSEARRLRGETPLSYQNMLAFIHGDPETQDFLEQEWQEDLVGLREPRVAIADRDYLFRDAVDLDHGDLPASLLHLAPRSSNRIPLMVHPLSSTRTRCRRPAPGASARRRARRCPPRPWPHRAQTRGCHPRPSRTGRPALRREG